MTKSIGYGLMLCLLLLPTVSANQQLKQEKPRLVFGVVPQQAASTLARKWAPLLDELSTQLPYQLQFATAPDIPTFEQRLADGVYDVAYMNPYHYVVFHQPPTEYTALAKEKNKRLAGIIVVGKDSGIDSINQLNGAQVAFPAPAAFAASIIPRASLAKASIVITPKYVGSHDSVYLAVAQGLVSAGGGVMRTFNNMPDNVRDKLKILWQTQGYTPHAFATHHRVSPAQRQALLEALTAKENQQRLAPLLGQLGFKSFSGAKDSDWDDVRALSLGELTMPLQGN
ncbi:phosphate/phosphite/phosphonate ABC transporter substrate-binding protein [Shewanella sp. Scap07]|uniref:phosphate/phosphite/phosphonate ABC transporter substrate-binding protein n=1 Tax=Shewanella sp. Scap07 TaxID=2589987 RepID=UPI0015BB07D1|nr:phosphate/phosphite/phosphonate ABC transporter substrate-binding protein [Shewanella sp. Scap07]QLE86045.1 phosphate/phosphite/phosphonate ABC transporter substrate-binding protein [Shewanella sp. Scap07]